MAGRRSAIGPIWRRGAPLAVVAVLGVAVYVSLDRQGNGGGDAFCAATTERAAALDPFVGGEVAAFRIASEPQRLGELAFDDAESSPTTLGAFEGQVTLVNLWATWCAPCRREMPALDRLQAARGSDDFAVVPISVDTSGRARSEQFLQSIGTEHLPLYTDETAKIFDELKGRGLAVGLPVTLLIDRNGCHLGHLNGPAEWDTEDALQLIDAAVGT